MVKLSFESIRFGDGKGKKKDDEKIRIIFMKRFYLFLDKNDLLKIADFKVTADKKDNCIEFKGINKDKALTKFMFLIEQGLKQLKTIATNNPATYIHKNSGIPLIGLGYIGIVDRNSSIIEIKPNTGCNLNCIFCSVGEGITSRKNDFVVEEDYLIETLKKLVKEKGHDDIEVHIGTHGEPLLYSGLAALVRDVAKIPNVNRISMDTNGTMLNKEKIDELVKAGMTNFNISINSTDPKLAMRLAGIKFESKHQLNMAEYIALLIPGNAKLMLNIAPIWVPGYNDEELDRLADFVNSLRHKHKTKNIRLAIQNFLEYKGGRSPAKQKPWEEFYRILSKKEKQHDLKLIYSAKDFFIVPTKKLLKPFRKGDIVKIKALCAGRTNNETICILIDNKDNKNPTGINARAITTIGPYPVNSQLKVKIIRDKHNIFVGKKI